MRTSGVDELRQVGGAGEARYRLKAVMCKRRSPGELGLTDDDFSQSVFSFVGWPARQPPPPPQISQLSIPLDKTTNLCKTVLFCNLQHVSAPWVIITLCIKMYTVYKRRQLSDIAWFFIFFNFGAEELRRMRVAY